MTDPPTFTPREAVDRWLDRQRLDKADQTVAGYRLQLKLFVEYCDRNGIDQLDDLTPWDIQEFETDRRSNDIKTVTLRNELLTLRQVLEHYARLGVLDEAIADAIELPTVSRADQTDDTVLEPEDAEALLAAYRNGDVDNSRGWAFLELAWFTGARMGAIRALDLDHVDLDEQFVEFHHRPDEDTPLKNAHETERAVAISDEVVRALREYLATDRPKGTDAHGRRPLFATSHGRMSTNTLRTTSYYATLPCHAGDCPHGKEIDSCEWRSQAKATKCPSSRSPHQVRSGSITWQLNRGIRADLVSDRVNASVSVIEDHYDLADPVTEMRERRQRHLEKLGFEEDSDE